MNKENNFSILHIFAACMVFVGHMYVLLGFSAPRLLNTPVHGLGVSILFFISGFLVAQSYNRSNSLLIFYLKRLVRLYPALIACVIITVIILSFFSSCSLQEYMIGAILYIGSNILMYPRFILPGIFTENPYPATVNGSLWTLPIELMMFLLLPLFMLPLKKISKRKISVFFLLITFVPISAIYLSTHWYENPLVFWGTNWTSGIYLITYFILGIAFTLLTHEQQKKYCRLDIALILLCIILCFGEYYPSKMNYFFVPYITISFAYSNSCVLRDFFNKHDYVYGLYLYGFPVQQTIIYVFNGKFNIPTCIYLILSFGITLILSIVSRKYIEAPAQQLFSCLLKKEKLVPQKQEHVLKE